MPTFKKELNVKPAESRTKPVHPCFDFEARHEHARVHLPVAPKCNIQCNFCDKKSGCQNENRPGVSTEILSPEQALVYFNRLTTRLSNISVVGIAGPGDAFATPEITLETLRLIKQEYPSMLFCIATNGLNVMPYIDSLVHYGVTHVTVTVNAVDPGVGEKIYAWAHDDKNIYRGRKAAELLIGRQLAVIKRLCAEGIVVKVNTVVVPGVNDEHVVEVAKVAGSLGAEIFNAMPIYPLAGTEFADVEPLSSVDISRLQKQCGLYVKQMSHCQRCRADAAGLLNEPLSNEVKEYLRRSSTEPLIPSEDRPYVAAATLDDVFVNQHLGAAKKMSIYKEIDNGFELVERRALAPSGCGDERWNEMAKTLQDCKAVLVSKIGGRPREILHGKGIMVYENAAPLVNALDWAFNGKPVSEVKNYPANIFAEKGSGGGCGSTGGCNGKDSAPSCSAQTNANFCC